MTDYIRSTYRRRSPRVHSNEPTHDQSIQTAISPSVTVVNDIVPMKSPSRSPTKQEPSLSDLRAGINDLSRISMLLYSGCDAELYEKLQFKVGRVTNVLSLHEKKLIAMQNECDRLLRELAASESLQRDAMAKLANMEIKLHERTARVNEAEYDAGALKGERDELKATLNSERVIRAELAEKSEQLQAKVAQQCEEIAKARVSTESNLRELQRWLKSAQSEIDGLKDKNAKLRQESEARRVALSDAISKNDDLSSECLRLKNLESSLSKLEQRHTTLSEKAMRLETENTELALKLKEKSIRNLKLTQEKESISAESGKTEGELKVAEQRCEQLSRKLRTCEKELSNALAVVEQSEAESKLMEQKLGKKRVEATEMEIELNNVRAKMTQSMAKSMADMEEQRQKHARELAAAMSKLKQEMEQRKSAERENEELKEECSSLAELLRSEKETVEQFSLELKQVAELRAQFVEMQQSMDDGKQWQQQAERVINAKNEAIAANSRLMEAQAEDNAQLREKMDQLLELLQLKDGMIEELRDRNERANATQQRLELLQRENAGLMETADKMRTQLDKEQKERFLLNEKVAQQSEQFQRLLQKDQSEFESMTKLLSKSEKETSKYVQKNEGLRDLLREQKELFDKEKSILHKTVDRLKRELEYTFNSNNKSATMFDTKVTGLNKVIRDQKQEIENREQLLSKLSMELSKAKAEIALNNVDAPVRDCGCDGHCEAPKRRHFKMNEKRHKYGQNDLKDQIRKQKEEVNELYNLVRNAATQL